MGNRRRLKIAAGVAAVVCNRRKDERHGDGLGTLRWKRSLWWGLGLGLGIRVRNCLWMIWFIMDWSWGKALNPAACHSLPPDLIPDYSSARVSLLSDIFPFLRHIRKPNASPHNPISFISHIASSLLQGQLERRVFTTSFSLLLKAHLYSFPISDCSETIGKQKGDTAVGHSFFCTQYSVESIIWKDIHNCRGKAIRNRIAIVCFGLVVYKTGSYLVIELVPEQYKNNVYVNTLQANFVVNDVEHKQYILGSLGKKWKDKRRSAKTMEIANKNAVNRAKLVIPHSLGSKTLARKRNELEVMHSREFSRAEMYQVSHKKPDGSFVNEEARELHLLEMVWHEYLNSICGKEHPGYVRGMGLGVSPSQVIGSSSRATSSTTSFESNERIEQMQAEINSLKAQVAEVDVLKQQIAFLMQRANIDQSGSGLCDGFCDGSINCREVDFATVKVTVAVTIAKSISRRFRALEWVAVERALDATKAKGR
ncbi:hypothetical protein Fmac_011639 [Flemingia macrophylla]|uniref:Uncharacterized protein n=1 Tax=Flemingia macrophylla TaxID=520843 RepID=A0ABD1MN06_9FABA